MSENLATQNEKIAGNIRAYGWHCLHVSPVEENQDRFSYSIGFAESYNAPEVLIFGLEREKAHALLNECAHLLKDGHRFCPNTEDANVLSGGYKVVFKSVCQKNFDEYLGTALRYYQEKPFDAMVMFLPDRQHHFPWDSDYDGIPAEEPLSIV